MAVFLTHTDGDHAGALGLFEKANGHIFCKDRPNENGPNSKNTC